MPRRTLTKKKARTKTPRDVFVFSRCVPRQVKNQFRNNPDGALIRRVIEKELKVKIPNEVKDLKSMNQYFIDNPPAQIAGYIDTHGRGFYSGCSDVVTTWFCINLPDRVAKRTKVVKIKAEPQRRRRGIPAPVDMNMNLPPEPELPPVVYPEKLRLEPAERTMRFAIRTLSYAMKETKEYTVEGDGAGGDYNLLCRQPSRPSESSCNG